jgi:S-adenosylmethionine:tRNA ribosyltransferase-isomerase
MEDLYISDYSYELPASRVAEYPLPDRDASKLLVYIGGLIKDDHFFNLPVHLLREYSVLVLNSSKVIHARIHFQKETGGVIEIFCLEPFQPATTEAAMQMEEKVQWRCLIGGASKWKHGLVLQKKIQVKSGTTVLTATYIAKEEEDFIIEFSWDKKIHFAEVLESAGNIPLPPYIKRDLGVNDDERYQTVFAKEEGSVAAPTASLHFTEKVFAALDEKEIPRCYLTLHVGAGTFKPVKTETISGHQMHAESFSVTSTSLEQLEYARLLVAGGTTSLRALESLYWIGIKIKNGNHDLSLSQWEAYNMDCGELKFRDSIRILINYLAASGQQVLHCRTSLLIRPGYKFHTADALITNFHQPGSTLLLLVAAFVGEDWRKIYQHALDNDYRFLSYGDASLLFRQV